MYRWFENWKEVETIIILEMEVNASSYTSIILSVPILLIFYFSSDVFVIIVVFATVLAIIIHGCIHTL